MANQEHLDILKQGVEVWNRWRGKNSKIRPDLSGAGLFREYLGGVDFHSADLSGANLRRAYLGGASLQYSVFNGANLIDADLSAADLDAADLIDANLSGANLDGAAFTGADLIGTDLRNANLCGANLGGAALSGANLGGAILVDANLAYVRINRTVFADNDLSVVKGLEKIDHIGPSTIGVDTLVKSGGRIPEVFLRGCGVPDTFIAFAKSLVGKAMDYYSAFISYSSKNTDIAERLHADLQSKGVRCWFAPEDIKIGDKFRQRIDEAIRTHEKLLLILSEDSMASNWVEVEVESAFEREHREKRLVLFPIRIDDAIRQSNTAWAASLRRMRHIGDFSRWKEHDAYNKAFERLLRDLKAEDKA